MSNEQKYKFHGGPLDGQTIDGPDKGMGRNPNYLLPADNGLAVIRADKADQIIGRSARTGSEIGLYFLKGEFVTGWLTYAWVESVTVNLHETPWDGAK